jgi:hypothetical protein
VTGSSVDGSTPCPADPTLAHGLTSGTRTDVVFGMDPNPYAAPVSSLDTPTPGTVSMMGYGVLCLLALLVTLTAYVLVSRLAGVPTWQGAGILCLLASVHFAGWRFVRTHRRVMSPLELKRFALACAVAFWVFDEVPALITRF